MRKNPANSGAPRDSAEGFQPLVEERDEYSWTPMDPRDDIWGQLWRSKTEGLFEGYTPVSRVYAGFPFPDFLFVRRAGSDEDYQYGLIKLRSLASDGHVNFCVPHRGLTAGIPPPMKCTEGHPMNRANYAGCDICSQKGPAVYYHCGQGGCNKDWCPKCCAKKQRPIQPDTYDEVRLEGSEERELQVPRGTLLAVKMMVAAHRMPNLESLKSVL